jgi:hypothetical protein
MLSSYFAIVMAGLLAVVIASQRVRPEVAGPMTGSAKQSSGLA